MSAFVRIVVCAWVFGYGSYAIGHGALGFVVAGVVALFINRLWRDQHRIEAATRHREEVVADEQLRLDVMHRREKEGRLP